MAQTVDNNVMRKIMRQMLEDEQRLMDAVVNGAQIRVVGGTNFKVSDTPRSGPDVNSGHAHSGPAHNRKDRST